MPWKENTVERLREEFVLAAKTAKNFSSLCREFGITRKTGYKWVKRDAENEPLSDRSHNPKSFPHKTSPEIESKILRVRYETPEWGGKTIKKVLENNGHENLPCVKIFDNIIKRNGLVDEAESMKRKHCIRFQREYCNELWQTDFKGDFALADGTRCFPLTILDDCSRYSIAIFNGTNALGVKDNFEIAFR